MAFCKTARFIATSVWLIITCGGLEACDRRVETSDAGLTCDEKADRGKLDEACVIAITKAEIAARFDGDEYSKYDVRLDPKDGRWIVMAYDEDAPPDSHTFLTISPNGKVEDIHNRVPETKE